MNNGLIINIALIIVLLLLGGSVTVGGLIVENPLGGWLKQKLIGDTYIIQRFNQLQSYHVATAVLAVKKGDKLTGATLRGASTKANEFFGKRAESKDLTDKNGQELMNLLREWMNPDDYDAFLKDQNRLFAQYGADQEAHAKVPVIFNDKHPNESYRHGIFLPVIVSLGSEEKKKSDESEQILEITYLDLKPLIPIVEKYKNSPGRLGESKA